MFAIRNAKGNFVFQCAENINQFDAVLFHVGNIHEEMIKPTSWNRLVNERRQEQRYRYYSDIFKLFIFRILFS